MRSSPDSQGPVSRVRLPTSRSQPRSEGCVRKLLLERTKPRVSPKRVPCPNLYSEVGPCSSDEQCLKMLELMPVTRQERKPW